MPSKVLGSRGFALLLFKKLFALKSPVALFGSPKWLQPDFDAGEQQ